MVKIYVGKLPDRKIVRTVNGETKSIVIPSYDVCTIYEQSGQLYYSINNERPTPLAS